MKGQAVFQNGLYILLKFAVYFVIITGIFTLLSGKPLWVSFGSAITLAIVSYIGGDLFMLPIMGNFVSTIGDLILNAIAFYMISSLFALSLPFYTILLTSLATCVFEYLFHRFLTDKLGFHFEV